MAVGCLKMGLLLFPHCSYSFLPKVREVMLWGWNPLAPPPAVEYTEPRK